MRNDCELKTVVLLSIHGPVLSSFLSVGSKLLVKTGAAKLLSPCGNIMLRDFQIVTG